jgi:hypothetical protein
MPERFFCALESRARGEAMFGTVAQIRSWLLLEYPSVWRRNAIADSRLLSPELKHHIRGLGVDRALLVRRDHRRAGPLHCFFVTSSEDSAGAHYHVIDDYEQLRTIEHPGTPVDGLMFAVCTHGRHDRCCAKFGMPLWCAFRDCAGPRAWQTSHVGGDRFAGNVVVFPYGIYYGRATPEDVAEIIRRSDAGEVWLPGYRGRSCFPRAVQVAEYFARLESSRLRIDEFLPHEAHRLNSGAIQVTLEARSDRTRHTVEYVTRPKAFHQRLTCEAAKESDVAQYDLRSYTVTPL